MHLGTHLRSPSRVVMRLLLLLALAAASLTLTHCRMIGDKLTGVGVGNLQRANDCLKACKDVYKQAIKDEDRLHRDRERACNRQPACIAAENARHAAAIAQIEAAYAACKASCHEQGGGGD